jgi:hypothetical protein
MKPLLKSIKQGCGLAVVTASALLAPSKVHSQSADDYRQLKGMVEQMQKTIDAQNARIAELETGKTNHFTNSMPALFSGSPSYRVIERIAAGGHVGTQSPVTYRQTLDDRQEAASRPKDYTLDPDYRGFIPIPNTPALIKFNAKPRLDVISDNRNPGSKHRFVPALFPLQSDPNYGGGEQANLSANATQLRLDVRAPEMDGDFRFYYQNDFFGSDTADMRYRLQHIYGQLYNFKAGFTYGVWEDPDLWPDTVDYEGPNAVIFSRRPVAQYTVSWNEKWNTTFGLEKPDTFIDVNSGPNAGGFALTRVPDIGLNTRYEDADFGHLQFSGMLRDLGAEDSIGNKHHELGWGLNAGAGINLTTNDTVQLLGVYGYGVGGMGNDTSFLNSDAAFDANGEFKALRYWSGMAGFTHRWNSDFRSTFTYGYANLQNASGQAATFYHDSHYASANLIWQLRKRLSVGAEVLYGLKEARNGVDSGDHWRAQIGMVYSLFD